MNARMAARRLGVSPQRVCQLVQEGALERVSGTRGNPKVTAESVRRRLAAPPRRGVRNPPSVGTWKTRRSARMVTEARQRLEAARAEAGSRELLTYEQVCERLHIDPRRIRGMVEHGELQRVTVDRNTRRVTVESVELLEARNNFL